ncbi:MAG: F0F1 ATP synthase subunit epsilon [Planctomycetaceae bacterium]|nr:F0F1 ATP synthase subunit epsilon [Planctomycetaceae bacterium]
MPKPLRLVLVTPETTLLDEAVESLQFPLYDGQIGILPGRAPLVGRLGTGELLIRTPSTTRSYFIDGGFVQVKSGVVSLLTNAAVVAGSLNASQAEAELQAAQQRVPHSDVEFAAKSSDQYRARKKLALSRKPR